MKKSRTDGRTAAARLICSQTLAVGFSSSIMTECFIRDCSAADLEHIAAIYRRSIETLGPQAYSEAQVTAWASHADDSSAFKKWIEDAHTLVAVQATGSIVGFGSLETCGRVSALFVDPAVMRTGVGSCLLQALIEHARVQGLDALTTHASAFSRPLFEKFGFETVETEDVTFKGVAFQRHAMRVRI